MQIWMCGCRCMQMQDADDMQMICRCMQMQYADAICRCKMQIWKMSMQMQMYG